MKEFFQVLKIWAFYLVFVLGTTFLLNRLGFTDIKVHSIKEVLFASWGYGWDGMHYIRIATQGYHFPLQAFFPLYPSLIWLANSVLPLTLAYRINIFLLLATLYSLVKFEQILRWDEKKWYQNIFLFLCFPTAFFLQANYSECLYILISIWFFICLRNNKFLVASFLGLLLASTKLTGIIAAPIILLVFLGNQNVNITKIPAKKIAEGIFYAMVPLLGILGYFWYLNNAFGSFTVFFKAQNDWGRQMVTNNSQIGMFIVEYFKPILDNLLMKDISTFRRLCELAAVVLSFFVLKKSFKKLPLEIWIFCLLHILVLISSGTFMSFNRLILLTFPLILYFVNSLNKKYEFILYVLICGILQIVGIYLFLNGVFVG